MPVTVGTENRSVVRSPAADGGRSGHRVTKRSRKRTDLLPYVLVAPLTLFIIGLALVPAVFTMVQAFYRVQPLDPPIRFTGFDNFQRLFSDSAVVASFGNTALYVLVGVVMSTVLGILMAVTLQHSFFGRSALIAVLILPWALPGVVAGIVWSGIWDANSGLLNSVLSSFDLISHYQVFLGQNQFVTILAIELVQVWQITPLSTLLILASLQNIPDSLYEAANIDGCSGWSRFRQITLPLVRPGIAIAAVQAMITTLNIFDQPFILNGAATSGTSVMMQTYFISFQDLDFGQGYALALLLTVTTLVISLVLVKVLYRRVEF
jgi:multiple sugar transport system permease protein